MNSRSIYFLSVWYSVFNSLLYICKNNVWIRVFLGVTKMVIEMWSWGSTESYTCKNVHVDQFRHTLDNIHMMSLKTMPPGWAQQDSYYRLALYDCKVILLPREDYHSFMKS